MVGLLGGVGLGGLVGLYGEEEKEDDWLAVAVWKKALFGIPHSSLEHRQAQL